MVEAAKARPPQLSAVSGTRWRDDFCCLWYGSCNMVCAVAWGLFILLPLTLFLLAAPGILREHGATLLTAGLALFALTALLFCVASCADPGVAPRGLGSHPGPGYTYCPDSNRYVAGFDHYCDFLGNDVGARNIPIFVAFLLSIGCLAAYLVAISVLYVADMLSPPDASVHLVPSPPRLALAALILGLVLYTLHRCSRASYCEGVLPLMMMMPGAYVGVAAFTLVLGGVVTLTLTSDMWAHVSMQSNPGPLYLLLPMLAFAVLFLGMSAHWTWLLCTGLTQKLFLRAKGWRRRKPGAPAVNNTEML